MTENNVRMHPGYALEYWKLKALFEKDPDIKVGELDDANKSCEITIKSTAKANLFNSMSRFQYLTVHVTAEDVPISEEALAQLFSSNPYFSKLYTSDPEDPIPMKAVLFNPVCMHYYSDDMFSPTGHTAILPQDLVKDLFADGLNIQTDLMKLPE